MESEPNPKLDMPDDDSGPSHFAHLGNPRPKRFGKKRILLAAGIVMGIAIIAGGTFWFLSNRNSPTESVNQQTAQPQPQENSEPTMPEAEAATPQTFKSTKQNLEITYRKDWKLEESADKMQITLTSPKVSYEAEDGQKTDVFTLKIRTGVPEAMEAALNKALAVKDSEVIGYTAPTEEQRYYTNLSYGGQDELFTFVMITGSTAFKVGQTIGPSLSLMDDTYLLIGGYGADESDSLLFDAVPVNSFDDTAVYTQAVDVIKSLKIF